VDGDAEALAARLRQGRPTIIGRIAHRRLLLDLLTVADAEVAALASGVRAALEA
jgi:seryl-tRNA(Sec) selenium transferase